MAKKFWPYQEKEEFLLVDEMQVPLVIIRESRSNVRTSIGKDKVYLRIPFWTSSEQKEKLKDWCHDWLRRRNKKSGILSKLSRPHIVNGTQLKVKEDIYSISIVHEDRKTAKLKLLKDSVFQIILPDGTDEKTNQDLCRKLINQILSKIYLRSMIKRVHRINEKYFHEEDIQVKLRYNYSKWGSCNARRTISLSTRLIFAPDEVIDYVIVHEMAHLEEMNHSPGFWAIVEKVLPNYREYEKWLKTNGHLCDY